MGDINAKLSEVTPILGTIDSVGVSSAAAVVSDYVDVTMVNRLAAFVSIGTTGSAGTVTLLKSSDTSGTTTTALKTAALTTASSNTQVILDWDAPTYYDSSNPYVAVKIVSTSTNLIQAAAFILGKEARYKPLTDVSQENPLTTVTIV